MRRAIRSRVRRVLAVAAVAACAMGGYSLASASSGATPPPGATAQCKDGTYSFSQTRSGTCSHHGGVAVWLTPSTTTPPATTVTPVTTAPTATNATTTAAPTNTAASGTIDVGKTILLAKRTKTSGCKVGANPDRRCSPGAYYSKLTTSVICASTFRTGPIRNVPESEKFDVEREYGLAAKHYGSTLEIDHIVSLELGGSNDIANLYPEKANANPGFHVKDKLENKLHELVCDGTMTLRSVQRQIAANWQALYKKAFGVAPSG